MIPSFRMLIPISLVLMIAAFSACSSDIVKEEEVMQYLENSSTTGNKTTGIETLGKQLTFWEDRLAASPRSLTDRLKVASLLAESFARTGRTIDLRYSDSLFHLALDQTPFDKTGIYESLSRNALTRHDFQSAREYARFAMQSARDSSTSKLLLIDVLMETGEISKASDIWQNLPSAFRSTPAARMREIKLLDKNGRLNDAIAVLEALADQFSDPLRPNLYCWAMSNLGDMYGHAGAIEKSYDTYLKVLDLDPSFDHVFKGIAWIAFARDGNVRLARKITSRLRERNFRPDHLLQLSDYAAYEGNLALRDSLEKAFIEIALQPGYGRMYHRHVAEMIIDDTEKQDLVRELVEAEMHNRPDPMTQAIYGRYLVHTGQQEEARLIADRNVAGKSFEPMAHYQLGMLYLETSKVTRARKYLEEAATAKYELGPVKSQEVAWALRSIGN